MSSKTGKPFSKKEKNSLEQQVGDISKMLVKTACQGKFERSLHVKGLVAITIDEDHSILLSYEESQALAPPEDAQPNEPTMAETSDANSQPSSSNVTPAKKEAGQGDFKFMPCPSPILEIKEDVDIDVGTEGMYRENYRDDSSPSHPKARRVLNI